HTRSHKTAVAFGVEEFARGLAQQFLLFGKADIHGASAVFGNGSSGERFLHKDAQRIVAIIPKRPTLDVAEPAIEAKRFHIVNSRFKSEQPHTRAADGSLDRLHHCPSDPLASRRWIDKHPL